jgi:hypothetical protein
VRRKLSLYYAINRAENPSSETILQTFDHVTKETIFLALLIFLKPQGLKPVSSLIADGTAEAVPFHKSDHSARLEAAPFQSNRECKSNPPLACGPPSA